MGVKMDELRWHGYCDYNRICYDGDMVTESAKYRFVVGVDEAGRGPLAGPVAVGVVAMAGNIYEQYCRSRRRIPVGRDSKKLSVKQRDFWFAEIKTLRELDFLNFSVALVSHKDIDRFGIVPAIQLGINGSLARLKIDPTEALILLDGGLHAPAEFANQQTIIGGDEQEAIIGLASVAAKVSRDRRMIELSAEYPEYHFDQHKGYGTALHRRIIEERGLSVIHRRSFCRHLTKKN